MDVAPLEKLHKAAVNKLHGTRTTDLLGDALALVGNELAEVRQRASTLCSKPSRLTSAAALHLMGGGGKGVRPLLTLLAARASGGDAEAAIPHAVAAELVHNASLLHDDVLDDGKVRRGRPTPRMIWGNTISVLSGDLLFVNALRIVEEAGPPELLRSLMATVTALIEGEVVQFEHKGRFAMELATYDQIVELKTASLFRWCARAGAVVGGASPTTADALGRFGYHVGVAFQVRDDVLDLTTDTSTLGKTFAADLADGKLTLPLIHALAENPDLADLLATVASAGADANNDDLAAITAAVAATGGLDKARRRMHDELQLGLAALEELDDREELRVLRSVAAALGERGH